MRKVLSTCAFVLLLISDFCSAETLERGNAIYCGYDLENLQRKVLKTSREFFGDIVVYKVLIGFNFGGEVKVGELKLSCFMSKGEMAEPFEAYRKVTAAAEIKSKDSGGRYYRLISWERVMTSKNWKGTIAYVKEIYGDHQRMPAPDFFYICPELPRLTCFSLTFPQEGALKWSEANAIPEALSEITIK